MKRERVATIDALTLLFSHAVNYIGVLSKDLFVVEKKNSLIGSTSFGSAQNMIHDFQNTVLNS